MGKIETQIEISEMNELQELLQKHKQLIEELVSNSHEIEWLQMCINLKLKETN